ncbi:hypothetical protein BJF92_09285 [Rhizobium rhizosphaerae]|uniref:Uncharacterized protein n=2 Tax=Xaviernesmea rhizosphaerae TaxID=1672749 RepID=A0A1Q9AG50_9HYPH|nr:hypothetical protein BJF92_09285 [Xaviernesmea rhizosphaerae]
MPFHAAFLALVVPPFTGALVFAMFGADLSLRLIASLLAPAYLLGAAPAFLCGRLDRRLARLGWSGAARLAVASGLGGLAGLVVLGPLFLKGSIHGALPLLAPVAFAFSAFAALGLAMLLAWLPAMTWKPPTPPEGDR